MGSRLLCLSGVVGANGTARSLGSLGGTGLGLPPGGGLPTIEESHMEGGSRPLAILTADSGALTVAQGPGRGGGEGAGGSAASGGFGAGHEHVGEGLGASALGSVGVLLGGVDEGEDGEGEVMLGRAWELFAVKPHRD